MILTQVFERFVKDSPVSIMVRGLLEKILSEISVIYQEIEASRMQKGEASLLLRLLKN